MLIYILIVFCILINIILGMYRKNKKKFSLQWFIAIHGAVPIIIALRFYLGIPPIYIPLLILSSVMGQILGGKI